MTDGKRLYTVQELIDVGEPVKNVNGQFTIVKVGESYEYKPGSFNRKFSIIDYGSEKAYPYLTLTLFYSNEEQERSEQVKSLSLGDDIFVSSGYYEPYKGKNDFVYHNLTLGRYGKISLKE